MRRIFNFLVLFAILAKATPQVLNGRPVGPQDLKFLVYLKPYFTYYNDYYGDIGLYDSDGAGTIVHLKWILTAAHVVKDFIRDGIDFELSHVEAVVGTKDRTNNEKTITIYSEDVYKHREHNARTHLNDVALLRLRDPLVRSATLEPARLLPSGVEVEYGADCVVAGWGHAGFLAREEEIEPLEYDLDLPVHAMQGTLKLLKPDKCLNKYKLAPGFFPEKQFCYGCTEGYGCSQTAPGDSGGPVVCALKRKKVHSPKNRKVEIDDNLVKDDDPMKYQYVFAVHSTGCPEKNLKCTSEGPSYGMRVPAIKEWMRGIMGQDYGDILNAGINSYVIAAAAIAGSICVYFL